MKKLLVVLSMLAFAATAFAQEEAKKGPEFKYSIWADAFAVTEQTQKEDEQKDYSAIRLRPTFSASIENVKVVTTFEIDQFFGAADSTEGAQAAGNGSTKTSGYADADTDQIAVEVKNAYINVTDMFVTGLSLTAGLAPYIYSVGYNNDMPLFDLTYDAGVAKLDLAFIKVRENTTTEKSAETSTTESVKDTDDVYMYSGKLPVKIGIVTLTPAWLFVRGEADNDANTAAATAWNDATVQTPALMDAYLAEVGNNGEFYKNMPAFGLTIKNDVFSLQYDFVYIYGKNTTNNKKYTDGLVLDQDVLKDLYNKDFKAYAAYLNIGVKPTDVFSFNVFSLYATGQDDSDDITSFQALCGDEIEVGPMFIINDAGLINAVGVSNEFDKAYEGLSMAGIAITVKIDKFTALAQVAYARTASDDIVDETELGTEYDLRLSYEVAPKTSIWAEGAYLNAGKYLEERNDGHEDDPYYYAGGIVTSI